MDIVTHGLLGALVAQTLSRSRNLRVATVVGGIAALLPDLDVFIQSQSDPLLVLEYHRHFTHSIFFAPLVALLLTAVVAPIVRHDIERPRLFFIVLLAYISACLLDACTSYGTYLLWPLIDEPLALSIIAVVDPLFSFILLVAVIAAWSGHNRQRALVGMLFGLGYLALGWAQHQRVQETALHLVQQRQLSVIEVQVKPTMGNLLLWRAIAVTAEREIQVDGIRAGFSIRIYPGEHRALSDIEDLPGLPPDSRAHEDLRRYQQLNQPLLVAHSSDPWVIGDGRYAMLPTSADPLWGLQIDPLRPNNPSEFVTKRVLTPEMRQTFIDMLLGRDIASPAAVDKEELEAEEIAE